MKTKSCKARSWHKCYGLSRHRIGSRCSISSTRWLSGSGTSTAGNMLQQMKGRISCFHSLFISKFGKCFSEVISCRKFSVYHSLFFFGSRFSDIQSPILRNFFFKTKNILLQTCASFTRTSLYQLTFLQLDSSLAILICSTTKVANKSLR